MLSIGVDGCRSGWFYIELLDSSYRFGVIRTLESIVERYPANTPVFVDIPIGLVDDGSGGRKVRPHPAAGEPADHHGEGNIQRI